MRISFRCEHCDQTLDVPEAYAGRQVRCTGCREVVTVPLVGAPAPAADLSVEPADDADGGVPVSVTDDLAADAQVSPPPTVQAAPDAPVWYELAPGAQGVDG